MNPSFDGPIPGENYTSDTKNYPWHRPPDIVDFDEAVEYVVNQISEPEPLSAVLTLLEAGATISGLVSTINMVNISDGKYPIDLSILIAGPVARYIDIVAKQSGVKAEIGTPEDDLMTLEHAKGLAGILTEDDDTPEDMPVAAAEMASAAPSGGLMGAPTGEGSMAAPEGVQQSMLGYGNEEGMM